MPQLFIRKTIFIEKSVVEVFKLINDFHHWPKWSPWLIADPKVKIKVDPDGKYYNWESPILGSGEMSIEHEQENQSINCDLQFFKPWRSKAKVTFYLNAKNSGTEVVWTMRSSLPFYLSWMKKQMHVFIGMDYERGLNLLKDLAENGKNMCNLNFEGIITYEATHYYGFKRKSSYSNFKIEMAHDFKELMPYMTEHYKELVNGPPFSIFHKFNVVKGRVNYTIGFPIKYPIASSNQRYFVGSLPKMRVHSIEHLGPYRHLSNAWAAQMMYQRSKQFRPPKKRLYRNPVESYFLISRIKSS